MKIYCSKRSNDEIDLDRFVGTDYWVKCRGIGTPDLYWVHFLSKDDKNRYKAVRVNDYYLNNKTGPGNNFSRNFILNINNLQMQGASIPLNKNHFDLYEPLDIITTEELVEMLEKYENIL